MTLATPSSEACPPTKQRGYPRPPPSFPRRREPREKQSTPPITRPRTPTSFPRGLPRTPIRGPEHGKKRAGHPTNHSRRSPLPRWERARACPGLEPGVRVNHSRPSRTRRPKGAGHHSLYANPTTSVSATEALKPVIPSHPHRHSRAGGNPEPGDKWERGIIAHLRKSA